VATVSSYALDGADEMLSSDALEVADLKNARVCFA
jgi:hypothetical protein